MKRQSIIPTLLVTFALLAPSAGPAQDTTAAMHDAAAKYREQQLQQLERAIAELDRLLDLAPNDTRALETRGELHFKSAQIDAALDDFDRFLELRPDRKPYHWQRGIALYYAGQYEEGVRQFESHKSVNPQDVENAIWHYLCKAHVDGVAKAREMLIDIDRDGRPWAMDVYRMFQGKLGPAELLARVEALPGGESQRRDSLFFAHLCVGLYYEAAGQLAEAAQHIDIAVQQFPCSHYMGDVARVHRELRNTTVNK